MKVLYGKRQNVIHPGALAKRVENHFPVHIDVGTGSGRLIFKLAGMNHNGFFIGMDPSADSMCKNSVKAAKNYKKTKLDNLLFVIAPIEAPPEELVGIADVITVILPWSSLRDGLVKADPLVLCNIRKLGKPGSVLEIIVGYDERIEQQEVQAHSLSVLSLRHFEKLAPRYRNAGIEIRRIVTIDNNNLKLIETDWAKKLAYGRPRTMYSLDCVCI